MIKPNKLNKGDIVATVSPSWGCAVAHQSPLGGVVKRGLEDGVCKKETYQ